jgi:AraC-like DNA-binding protein
MDDKQEQEQEQETPAAEEPKAPTANTSSTQGGGVLAQQFYGEDETIGNYSMNNLMDRQLMKNVEQYVIQNMSRGQISLEEMASAMGMGRVPFFHKIRSITTKTPAEIVREIRLKHACTLLTQTNINMSELAINVGFNTAENFINIFKDKFGMTPLEYRLKNKK